MFYVELPKAKKQVESLLIHLLPTLIIFLVLVGVTFLAWGNAKSRVNQERQDIVNTNTFGVKNRIDDHIKTYEEILRGAGGLFVTSDTVTMQDWKDYVKFYEIEKNYQGIQGVGYAPKIESGQLPTFLQATNEFLPGYSITPAGERPYFIPVLYFEPSLPQSKYGYDLSTDKERSLAIKQATETGTFAITTQVFTINDTEHKYPSFIMYYPIFEKNKPSTTPSGRQENVAGYVFVALRIKSLFSDVEIDQNHLGFRVFGSSEHNNSNKLYETNNFDHLSKTKNSKITTTSLDFYGQKWVFDFVNTPGIGTPEVRQKPNTILVAGLIASFLVSALVYSIMLSRTKILSYNEEAKLQGAKDELLALASHQLRTPATGVKQYIGMLRDGFAGKLTKQQKQLLDKAYESNERQLATVTQMLSVARIDAGQLRFDMHNTDVSKLLRDVIDEQRSLLTNKRQKLNTEITKNIMAKIDRQHFRMVLENLLNNASKYTPSGGTVSIQLIDENETFSFIIEDSGVGIDQEDIPLLFQKFVRISNKLTKKVSGSGLGLYLANNIAEAHSGTIYFEPAHQKGTIFTVTIPKDNK